VNGSAKYLVDLVRAGLIGDYRKVETVALSLARSIKKDNPEISMQIQGAISLHSVAGASAIRSAGGDPIPTDSDSQLEMANVIIPNSEFFVPILNNDLNDRIDSLLEERNNVQALLSLDIKPSTNLLLIGKPGTGKTMLAHYIASKLKKNLLSLIYRQVYQT
jgi:hypothetical protein